MLKRLAVAAALVFSFAACEDPTLPPGEPIRARAAGSATLAITNRGGEPVYFHAMDPSKLAIFYNCTPAQCPRIEPGETVRVPYAAISLYEAGTTQALVDWYTFEEPGDGSYRQKSYGSVLVDL
jgi:hypothetical protein